MPFPAYNGFAQFLNPISPYVPPAVGELTPEEKKMILLGGQYQPPQAPSSAVGMPPYVDAAQGLPTAGPVPQTLMSPPTNAPAPDIGKLLLSMSTPGTPDPAAPTAAPAQPAPMATPAAPAAAATPAASPSMWDSLMGNDNLKQAIFHTGLQLMLPIQPGQTPLGAAAQSVSGGVDYLQQLKNMQKKQGLEERQVAAQETTAAAAKAKSVDTPAEAELKKAQAEESKSKAGFYDRSLGRNQNKLPATREDFLKQASLKAFSEFSTADDILNVMKAADIAADRIYGASGTPSAAAPTGAGAGAGALPPINSRVKDKVYPINGKNFKWTGTGWLPQ